jgi:hypothetical protein
LIEAIGGSHFYRIFLEKQQRRASRIAAPCVGFARVSMPASNYPSSSDKASISLAMFDFARLASRTERIEAIRREIWVAHILRRHGGIYSNGFLDGVIARLKEELEKETGIF